MPFWDKWLGKKKTEKELQATQRSQGSGVVSPPGFEKDIAETQRLAVQTRRDPHAIASLIQIYQGILGRLQPSEHLAFRAAIQNDLGVAYANLPMGDRAENLQRAIVCYQEALRFYTPESAPLEHARTHIGLGAAYGALPTEDRTENLQHAIDSFQESLRSRVLEATPLDYALAQYDLGVAYADLPTGDRAENLKRAITCYQEAMRFYTPETDPSRYVARERFALGTRPLA